jgi:hypothetical protein
MVVLHVMAKLSQAAVSAADSRSALPPPPLLILKAVVATAKQAEDQRPPPAENNPGGGMEGIAARWPTQAKGGLLSLLAVFLFFSPCLSWAAEKCANIKYDAAATCMFLLTASACSSPTSSAD